MTVVHLDHSIRGSGPDLLLLHGGGGSREDLDGLGDLLARRHRVIAPDQRLHGRSPDPGEITYGLMAADTAALLDELGVREADLVGWSDGGVIALFLARDRPDLVRRVVTMGANVDWTEGHQDEMLTEGAMSFFAQLWANPGAFTRPAAYPGSDGDWRGVVDRLVELWRRPPGITLADLASIRVPVLVLAGENDAVRIEHTLAMDGALPNGSYGVVPAASHGLPQEAPDLVATLIERFLSGT